MARITPELMERFHKFRDAYELGLVWLADAGGSVEQKERDAWRSALRAVPLSEIEEDLFRALMKAEKEPG